MGLTGILLIALAIAVGLAGVLVPILPGLLLVYCAIAVWAVVEHTPSSWITLGVVTALLGATTAVKYLWPASRMRRADVQTSSLVVGVAAGVLGFFVIPVIGLVIGFLLGVYLAELLRRRDVGVAWASTVQAVKGVALSVGVELIGGLSAAAIWLSVVVFG